MAKKLENCFATSVLLHLGHSVFSLPKTSASNFSLHFLQINSNNGIKLSYLLGLEKRLNPKTSFFGVLNIIAKSLEVAL
ncbi:hypothetical protein AGMMS49990_07330 [Endomicrobiia bacterium]|nr:hypothetical protein AGMMS49990_07330 [Endomicrobiia bacterium]